VVCCVQAVGRLLLDCLGDSSLAVVGEALDALFDVYADEDMDGVFFGVLNALEMLRSFTPSFQQRVRACLCSAFAYFVQVKRERGSIDREVMGRLLDAKTNLQRFIQYKQQHKP